MSTTVHDLIAYIERLSGHPLNRDEGIQHGADRTITGVTVCWMASPEAIRAAGAPGVGMCGDELLIGHESLYYPYDVIHSPNPPANWEAWQVNRQRRELLAEHDLTFLRAHGSLDEISIFDDFVARLGLGAPVYTDGLAKVFEIAPCPLNELVARVKARMGMPALRVSAPARAGPDRTARRAAVGRAGAVRQRRLSAAADRAGVRCLHRGRVGQLRVPLRRRVRHPDDRDQPRAERERRAAALHRHAGPGLPRCALPFLREPLRLGNPLKLTLPNNVHDTLRRN